MAIRLGTGWTCRALWHAWSGRRRRVGAPEYHNCQPRVPRLTPAGMACSASTQRGSAPIGETIMERIPLSLPEIALISGTRALAGAGIGLLLADRLNDDQRRAVGWTLLTVGALTTIPIATQLIHARRSEARSTPEQLRSEEP